MSDNNLDVIINTPTGRILSLAAIAGYPVGAAPLGYAEFNGRPFGVAIIAKAGREDLILRALSAWEGTVACCKPPPQMVNWENE